MMSPRPLPTGTRLFGDRYTIQSVLGQGGFGLTYLAEDRELQSEVVIKELAPTGAWREGLDLDFRLETPALAQRLRHQFLREAEIQRTLKSRGVPGVRATFQEHGTAYMVTEYIRGARTMDSILAASGPMDAVSVLEFLQKLCQILKPIHQRGILHRDIKPSNILVDPHGEVILIDFGSAREWHASHTQNHTVQFSPGFAPPEQMSERGRRSPATDIYAICATAYIMLVGTPPPSATDRLAGEDMGELPGVPADLAQAIQLGLSLRMEDRPQSVDELLMQIQEHAGAKQGPSVEELDARRLLLQRMSVGKRECPSCHGILIEPKPLPARACMVCREGRIVDRKVDASRCPHCFTGFLRLSQTAPGTPPHRCPSCEKGLLKRTGLPIGKKKWACRECGAGFQEAEEGILGPGEETRTWDEWVGDQPRSEKLCDACGAKFDPSGDGRWRQVSPKPRHFSVLYEEEWALVAAGFDPGAGNAECDRCGADYFIEDQRLTLLGAGQDPFGVCQNYAGLLIPLESTRWIGVGKSSGLAGFSCESCQTEVDHRDGLLDLVRSDHPVLRRHVQRELSLLNWHRVASELPLEGEEGELDAELDLALIRSYHAGHLAWDAKRPELIWRGEAKEEDSGQSGNLTITQHEFTFGGMIRKRKQDFESLRTVAADEGVLQLQFSDETWTLALSPQELEVRLSSGRFLVPLGAEDLARRIVAEKELRPDP